MQFLITGGAGFIGTALANRLVHTGHQVRVIDDLSTGNPDNLLPDVHFTRGDVSDKPKLWRLLHQVDCVYHLAARVSVPESILYPREYNTTNVGGTVALMEAMRDAGVKRVVFTSSGAIYGEHHQLPVTEDVAPRPTSPYGVSKLSAEYYINSIGQLWGIETVCLRIFNAYGPGQACPPAYPPVIPQFVRQALGKGSLTIYGAGKQVRDFVYIDDVVAGLTAAATADKVNRQIINIGSGEGTSINHLVTLIGQATQTEPQIIYVTSESAGISHLVADISTAQALLAYQPQVMLDQGLRQFLEKK